MEPGDPVVADRPRRLEARKFRPAPVIEVTRAVGKRGPDHRGKRVNQRLVGRLSGLCQLADPRCEPGHSERRRRKCRYRQSVLRQVNAEAE